MAGVHTVIVGVKNRTELRNCLVAEAAGILPTDQLDHVETWILGCP